jgi:hypothetical protein
MVPDRLPGNSLEVVDLGHVPALRLSVIPSPPLVMLRAFAAGLVLGRYADPDAYTLLMVCGASGREHGGGS